MPSRPRAFAGLAVGAGIVAALLGVSSPAAAATTPRVLVVAIPDLRWSDLSASATPAIWTLLSTGAAGSLSVKSQWQLAGCADGLLTLGAGDRVAAESGGAPALPCATTQTPATAPADGAGTLAHALRAKGIRTAALGPGAELALPGADVTGPLSAAATAEADVVVAVDDSVYAAPPAARSRAVRAVDERVASLLGPLPRSTTLLLVGSSDRPTPPGESGTAEAHLHVALARGPDFPPGSLSSPSTKRAPYVELIDLAPTVLSLVDVPIPNAMVGRGWESASGPADAGSRAAHLRDLDVKAVNGAYWRPPFMWALGGLALVVALVALLLIRRDRADETGGPGRERSARRAAELACYVVASLPVASWLVQLVPWWRAVGLLPALLLAIAGALGLAAMFAARRRPGHGVVVVTGVSALVLLVDLVSGSRLQTSALLGDSPITAGRFYGAGNTAFGVLAVSVLLGTAIAAAARPELWRAAVAAVVLLAAGAVDAAPSLGADLGGALAYLPSALLLVLLLTGARITWRRGLLALAAGAVPVVVLALWDYQRPSDRRTHIGDFVAQLLHGDAGSVIGRKLSANLGQLVSSPFLPLVVGTIALVPIALWLERPRLRRLLDGTPGLAPGLAVVAVCAVLGGVLNDSGVTVTGIMLSVALPAVSALILRADPSTPAEER